MSEAPQILSEEKLVYEFFLWSILLKGAISLAEIVVGVAVLFIPPMSIVGLATLLLNYIPFSHLQNALMLEVAKYTSGTVTFIAFYLLSRGLIKAGLIWGLLKNKHWAYPWSLGVLALFMLYQSYQILTTHSLLVIGITLFDVIVMYFIYREWKIVTRKNSISVPTT